MNLKNCELASSEMSGILNWLIDGVRRLLDNNRFTRSAQMA